MKITPVSFKGLWENKNENADGKRIGYITRKGTFACVPMYVKDVIYHPFRDETHAEVKREMERYSGAIIGVANPENSQDSTTDFVSFYYINAEAGPRLSITKDRYAYFQKLNQEPVTSSKKEFVHLPVDSYNIKKAFYNADKAKNPAKVFYV
ncbi:hypothetical protein II906_05210 [bacterium]|nr:hypothetical protein [bacterium]